MNTDDELRQALRHAADELQPGPDAWQQNQTRVRRRRRNTQIASAVGAVVVIGSGVGGIAAARDNGHATHGDTAGAHSKRHATTTASPTVRPTTKWTVRPAPGDDGWPVRWTKAMHVVGPVHEFHHYTSNGVRYSAYVAIAQNGKNRNALAVCEIEQPSAQPRPTAFPNGDCSAQSVPPAGQHVGRLYEKEPTKIPASPSSEFNYGTVTNDVQQLTEYMNKTRSGGPLVPHRATLLRGGPLTIAIVILDPSSDGLAGPVKGRTISGQSFSDGH